jgi:glucosamine-6-phosphate deaminase
VHIEILENPLILGRSAAEKATQLIKDTIDSQGQANIILATGASQFEVLKNLIDSDISWQNVTMFHLDEYIGMAETHPASFRKYLTERFLEPIDFACKFYLVDGENPDPQQECSRLSDIIKKHPIDVALIGIGENGHLAFNDPPADFETNEPYIVVNLDQACRQQQFGEGWFKTFDDVPSTAISMSINQILKSKNLIVSVPDLRKAEAVKNTVKGPLTNLCPGSILRKHQQCFLYLDKASASKM